jgi:hypothetical protein
MFKDLSGHPSNLSHQLHTPRGREGELTLPKTMLFSALVASSDSAMIDALFDCHCELSWRVEGGSGYLDTFSLVMSTR